MFVLFLLMLFIQSVLTDEIDSSSRHDRGDKYWHFAYPMLWSAVILLLMSLASTDQRHLLSQDILKAIMRNWV